MRHSSKIMRFVDEALFREMFEQNGEVRLCKKENNEEAKSHQHYCDPLMPLTELKIIAIRLTNYAQKKTGLSRLESIERQTLIYAFIISLNSWNIQVV